MRTLPVVLTAFTAAAAVGAAVLVSGQGAVAASGDSSFKAHESITGVHLNDIGPKGMSMGDTLAMRSTLKTPGGAKLAFGVGQCVLIKGTSNADALYHCTQTIRFAGGSIFTGGIFQPTKKLAWPIMGGTGKYRGATGEIDAHASSEDTFVDTFHIER